TEPEDRNEQPKQRKGRNGDENIRNGQCHFGRAACTISEKTDADGNGGCDDNSDNHNHYMGTRKRKQMLPAKCQILIRMPHYGVPPDNRGGPTTPAPYTSRAYPPFNTCRLPWSRPS